MQCLSKTAIKEKSRTRLQFFSLAALGVLEEKSADTAPY